MAWFEREERLKNLSPQHKEAWTNAYHGKLGIESGAFQAHVTEYLDKQDKALAEKVVDIDTLTPEQKATYDNLENLKKALRNELKTFTAEIKNLSSNTLAEALANEATEEKTLIIDKLKLLNQQTQAFTNSLPDTKKAGTADTTKTATTPDAATDSHRGRGIGTGGASSPWEGTHGGTGAGTGTDTSSDEEASLDTHVDADSDVPSDKDSTSKTTDFKPMTAAEAAALSDALDATKKNLDSTPELDELDKQLTGAITDMRRAAQLERDRIPLLAVLTANKRKITRFTSTVDKLSEDEKKELFSKQTASPPSVLVTGDDQVGVANLRKVFRQLDLSGQQDAEIKETEEKLESAKAALKKATENGELDNKKKYEKEIEEYNKKISELNQQTSQKAQTAAKEINELGGHWTLTGYKPGLTSLSGRHITVGAADQGLTFQMNFPAPLFSPGYYLSREHNTKADLVCMAELIKATGSKSIHFTIECRNPKMKQRLMQEAYEAALEVGFESITINGQEITKDNMHEQLYKHTDPETNRETNKYQRKKELAQKLQGIADSRRSEVKSKHGDEITNQQNVFKHAMKAERAELEQAAQNIKDNTPTPPSDEPGATSATIFPS